jgi:hypothetical protein
MSLMTVISMMFLVNAFDVLDSRDVFDIRDDHDVYFVLVTNIYTMMALMKVYNVLLAMIFMISC